MPTRASLSVFLGLIAPLAGAAESPLVDDGMLERRFHGGVRPFLETYCLSCHGKEKQEADLDLSSFSTLSSVVNGYSYWALVLERLEAGEMPPEKAKKHPTDQQREEVVAWLQALRKSETEKNAGDPGPVLAHRLSNAEYDYTIKDLTGADLRPTKEFPVDPANQAGFDNSGESLTMSPALVKKYLQAARDVADHLVLKPDGFEFAPHPVVADTDRDKYSVLRIVDFYKRQPTDLADYFAGAWRYRHRAALGTPALTQAGIAAESKISATYLATIWTALTDANDDVGPLAIVRSLWRDLPAPAGPTPALPPEVRAGAEKIREYVTGIREKIVPEVKNLTVPGMNNGSQTLVMWKNRQMAANRRRFDPASLHVADVAPSEETVTVAPVSPPPQPNVEAGKTPAAPRTSMAPRTVTPSTADIIQKGGTFLDPTVTTTGSSATFKMATAGKRGTDPELVAPADPAARVSHAAAVARFADIFPDAFYITERARVYLDAEKEQKLAGRLLSAGLHSMTGYFRDDGPLYDLILDAPARREIDRLWQEFDYYAAIPVRMHTSFVWFERTDSSYMRDPEFDPYRPEDKSVTTQAKIKKLGELYLAKAVKNNASEVAQQAIKEHFERVAAGNLWLEKTRESAVPAHLEALVQFAGRAYRRPLSPRERDGIAAFYRLSREENGVDHEEAVRDSIVRVLMSPNFCYRFDLGDDGAEPKPSTVSDHRSRATSAGPDVALQSASLATPAAAKNPTPPGRGTRPLSDYALASRLSYFLWSSMPDQELLATAAAGQLHRPEVLAAQARRMLRDARVRNFATEFAGNWLDFRRFAEHNAVDRERFPAFDNELRQAMFEEPLRFFVDLVREDRSVLNFLYGDYTFVNAPLARHYGMPAVTAGAGWVRVDHATEFNRGGLLPMAVFLTANSPGLRTSPVKRGYWVVRRVLGERIPPPPAVVPDLPGDEKNLGDLTLREVLAKHRADKTCASCHARFDAFGLVFEGFGPVGERRTADFGGRAVDTRAPFPGGVERTGLPGLRDYIRAQRENDFADNLCRKLLAYGLGRTLLMSDDSLIAEIKTKLAANDHRFTTIVEAIVTSPQFTTQRAATPAAEPAKTAVLR